MFRKLLLLTVLLVCFKAAPALATPIQVYGAWHCGNDACTWASVRDMTDFDVKNRWLVDRGDGTGLNHAARLTIDLAAGDRWLIALTRKATADWLNTTTPVLDYANAMVPSKQPTNAADAQSNWQEHIDGKAQYSPPILPLAAAKFTGALYIVTGQNPCPECVNFNTSLQKSTGTFVQTVATKVGTTNGMLGYMFWAAECPSTRRICTTPPNTCENGVGVGASTYNIPIPMQPLRQN